MQLMQEYERSSGQQINRGKIGFYVHNKFQRRSTVITRATGLLQRSFPFIYLGVLISYGRVKANYFEPLVDKVCKALEG